ncbi:MAG: dihydrolipoamide acetyltransferase family protein [Parvularculaceae bacterium]
MGEYLIKLPDVGEGVAEAELVEWHVKTGKNVREDEVLASVMTDKATVEIPSPVEGKVVWLGGEIGEVVAVGSPLIRLEVDGEGNIEPGAEAPAEEPAKEEEPAKKAKPAKAAPAAKPAPAKPAPAPKPAFEKPAAAAPVSAAPRKEGEKPLAAPAVRKRALDAGVDLRRVRGTGPAGRITHADLDAYFETGDGVAGRAARAPDKSVQEIPVIGLRRKIAEGMAKSKRHIPHITYVDEVDISSLGELRRRLNEEERDDRPKLTFIPFLMRAMAKAVKEQPQMNALYDDDAGVVHRYGGVHIGFATQTENGLVVPVVRHVEARTLWDCANEVNRLANAARAGAATREELSGSTITITSLGALGGIVTTPVINYPEVAIVGVNKIQVKPFWDGAQFAPRRMMNLSCSFDHRLIDGWNAAVFVQRIKGLFETPAMIFIED